jgi:hypothetical protein
MKITPEYIRTFNPCYDPSEYLAEDYSEELIDFIRHPKIPAHDKIWLFSQRGVTTEKTQRLFAVWCAREVLKLVADPDPRSIEACDVAERFANGEATVGELEVTEAEAWAAAGAAVRVAGMAARAVAEAVAWAAASTGIRVAGTAARAVAQASVRAVTQASVRAVIQDAVGAAVRTAQINHIIEMLEGR